MDEKALVSIITVTYNHKNYIRECLDSFLMQKTNFKFEILIHDDASNDGTTEIIKEYEQKYPDIIKPIYETENQFSKGISISRRYNFPRVKGKYVAVCEGDDYWTDSYKLQKQVDFLEANPDYSICFHPVRVIYDGFDMEEQIWPRDEHIQNGFTLENLLKYNFIQSSSIMYRWGFKDKNLWDVYPDGLLPGDWYMHLLHAKLGKIGYIDEIMSVYRRNPGGIWSISIGNSGKLHQKYALQEFKFYDSVFKYITDYSQDYYINKLIPCYKDIHKWLIRFEEKNKLNIAFQLYPEHFEIISSDYYIEKEKLSRKLRRVKNEIDENKIQTEKLSLELFNKTNELNLAVNKVNIYSSYYKYKFLSKILFGRKREHYIHKAEIYHEKVREYRKLKKCIKKDS